jgi:glycosyltransferase involved in cell wall biosynthesis
LKRILIFYQNSVDSVFIRSVIDSINLRGHKVFFLSLSPEGFLHEYYKNSDVICSSILLDKEKKISISESCKRLIKFSRTNEVDMIFSHLQRANLIALLSQYFIKAKVYPTRHHIDDNALSNNRNAKIEDKFVNLLSKKIIVVSDHAKRYLVSKEGVSEKKIILIPYGYNFELYYQPKENPINQNKIVLSTVGRINENKKTHLSIELQKRLKEANIDSELLIIGDGPDRLSIEALIKKYGLESSIRLTGNIDNVTKVISESDIIVHPSISEASNQVVKEAGLCKRTAIVVKGVGDFDEYIINGENGFIIGKENFVEDSFKIIKELANDSEKLFNYGINLNKTVLDKFSIDKCIAIYIKEFNL